MQQFLIRILWFVLLVIALSVVAVMLPDKGGKDNLLYGIKDKHALLEKTPGPRIIFVGGSNLAFGLDSKMVQDTFHMPVVNMGVHAGLGMRFIVEDVKPFLHKGDIVVLVPEYDHFYDRYPALFYGQDELLTMVLDVVPDEIGHLSLKQWSHAYQGLPVYIGSKYFNFFKYLTKDKTYKGTKQAYRRDAFNEYGDITVHLDMQGTEIPPLERREDELNPDVIPYFNAFYDSCLQQDIQVLMVMTSFQAAACDTSAAKIDMLEEAFANELKIPMLAEPRRYCLPNDWFWDSHEHLTRRGRNERTHMLIEDLRRQLNHR